MQHKLICTDTSVTVAAPGLELANSTEEYTFYSNTNPQTEAGCRFFVQSIYSEYSVDKWRAKPNIPRSSAVYIRPSPLVPYVFKQLIIYLIFFTHGTVIQLL